MLVLLLSAARPLSVVSVAYPQHQYYSDITQTTSYCRDAAQVHYHVESSRQTLEAIPSLASRLPVLRDHGLCIGLSGGIYRLMTSREIG